MSLFIDMYVLHPIVQIFQFQPSRFCEGKVCNIGQEIVVCVTNYYYYWLLKQKRNGLLFIIISLWLHWCCCDGGGSVASGY